MVRMKWQIIGITYETNCKSSLISVYTICHFKTTIYTTYIARINRAQKDQTVTLEEVKSGFKSICSGMIRCLKDIL